MEVNQGICFKISNSWKNTERGLNNTISSSIVGKYFKLEERNSCFTKEFRAATTTFLAMSYAITIVATVLSATGGTCTLPPDGITIEYEDCVAVVKSDLIVSVSLSAMLGCFAMGCLANLPYGLAPGGGQAMYMAYNMVGIHGSGHMKYSSAMGLWLAEALLFLLISATGLRTMLGRFIPSTVRLACGIGVGLFMAFVGLQSQQGLGLIEPDPTSFIKVNDLKSPTLWLGISGFIIMSYGLAQDVKGSMIYGILFVTIISWFRGTPVTYFPKTSEGEARYKYFKKVVDFHMIKKLAGQISFEDFNKFSTWVTLLTLVFIDILATTGSLYTLAELGGFVNEQGSFENEYIAYMIDALATVVGSALGVPPVSTYAESSAGIKEGGRTGLTAVIIGLYFAVALFFAPLLTSVPPWAVGPSLLIIGVILMRLAKDIDWTNMKEGGPAFITIILMPLTASIPNGIIAGSGLYAILHFYDYISLKFRAVMNRRKKTEESHLDRARNTDELI